VADANADANFDDTPRTATAPWMKWLSNFRAVTNWNGWRWTRCEEFGSPLRSRKGSSGRLWTGVDNGKRSPQPQGAGAIPVLP